MRVLVADDDPDIRFVVGSMLRRHGWQVTEAENGTEAISVLSTASRFDALVLDQNMPPGTGLEVIAWLRASGDQTPAVLFTGYVSALDRAAVAEHEVTVLDKVAVKRLPRVLEELRAAE